MSRRGGRVSRYFPARRRMGSGPQLEIEMRKTFSFLVALLLIVTSCGGDNSSDAITGSKTTAASGGATTVADGGEAPMDGGGEASSPVDAAPPGQALVTVDDQEFTFELPGGVACNIQEEEFGFSFRIGDNEITLGGGGFHSGSGWGGDVSLNIPEPEGDVGVTQYFIDMAEHGDQLKIDGNSLTYSGPWMMRPPNDGSNPPPVAAGEGTLSVTCS